MHPVLSQGLTGEDLRSPKLSWAISKFILKFPILTLSQLKLWGVAESIPALDRSIPLYDKAQA